MTSKKKKRPFLLPALIGNVLEWYDFTLYSYFAIIFATHYFPSSDQYSSLLGAYGILAISYFMRPIGALFFGYIGDKFSRKYSLYYSIILMGICSFAVSILPTYTDWGISAGITLAIVRLIQGFAVGGEYSGATLYLIESAPLHRKTFFGSLALSSTYSGFLISSAIGTLLTVIFPPDILSDWGWRVGFFIGGLIAIVGLYIRKKLPDTPIHDTFVHSHIKPVNPIKDLFLQHPRTLILALGIALLPAGFSYIIFVYFLSFLEIQQGIPIQEVFYMNTIAVIFLVFTIPIIGYLGDKLGRIKLMSIAAILTLVFCIPLFYLMMSYTLLALMLFTVLNALFEACIPAEISQLFPVSCRYSGLALTLNLTNGVAGGLAPIIATTLLHTTGILVSPMFYVITLSLITIWSLYLKINGLTREYKK